MKKTIQPPKESGVKQALLGLYGIIGVSISTFGPFKVPFAESHAKEYWRHALAGIFIVLALVAGIVSLAIYMFDANYFKSQMVDYVKIHNQRDLTLDGDIKVTFFPKLGLNAGKMSLSQRNSNKNFASIDNARFYVAWWPLFFKQLQVEHVDLDGVHANIVRHKDGSTNLDDLFTRDGSLNDVKFDIDSIRLKNSSINFSDEPTATLLSMHDMEIQTGRLTDSTPGNITATFRLESAKPRIDTKVKLNSHILFELKNRHYEFANFEIDLEGESAGITNLALNMQGTLNSFPATERLTVDKFVANLKGKLDKRKLDAKLDLPKLQLDKGKVSGTTLSLNANLLQEDENIGATIEVPAFEINENKFQSENIIANFDIFKNGRTLQGKLNSPLSVALASMEMQLPAISGSFSVSHPLLSSKVNANLSGIVLANFSEQKLKIDFKAKIDDSIFSGSCGVTDFMHPAYTFDLAVNKLDVDRYLVTDWAKRFQDDALPFDFSGLNDLNVRGKLRSGEFKFAKLKTSNLFAEIKVEQSSLTIEPLSARLYAGTALGSFSIAAGEIPKISFKQKLTGVQFNNLLADLYTGEAKLTGKGSLVMDLNATGINMGNLRKTLNGNVNLALGRGSVAGLNLEEKLLAGKTQLEMKDGEQSNLAKFSDVTAFTEFKSSFDINEGKASDNNFLMKSALFASQGEGEITLESGQLNFHINTTVAPHLKRSSNGELAELKGISIPMRISGPYAMPSIILDFANASGGKLAKPAKESPVKTIPAAAKTSKPAKK